MKTSLLSIAIATVGVIVPAHAGDPVADAEKLGTVVKTLSREEAHQQRQAGIAEARALGLMPENEWLRNMNNPKHSPQPRSDRSGPGPERVEKR